MKKFFSYIVFIGAFVSIHQSIKAGMPLNVQKQHDFIASLIQNADAKVLKIAFKVIRLPLENIIELEQLVKELQTQTINELEALGENTKNWSKIIKGASAMAGSAWYVTAMIALVCDAWRARHKRLPIKDIITLLNAPITVPLAAAIHYDTNKSYKTMTEVVHYGFILVTPFIVGIGTVYGPKIFKLGWYYKQHLQDKLASFDAIAEHIAHIKEKLHGDFCR